MDWAKLNPHLLHLIVQKLSDISNFICFGAVCKQWRLAAPPLTLLDSFHENKSYRWFYSLYTNKTQYLHLPQSQGENIQFGSSSQYVHIFIMNMAIH